MRKNAVVGWIPNLFTSGNMVCGIIAIYLVFQSRIEGAVWLMILAAFFDFLDGFIARLLKVSSEFGKQLDSLSDLISFGLLPGALMFFTLRASIAMPGLSEGSKALHTLILASPVLIPLFSAFRLAKFNIDPRQKEEFIGLPTPANALFFASLSLSVRLNEWDLFRVLNHPLLLSGLVVVFSILLVSNIPLFSLKFARFTFRGNEIRYVFLIGSTLLILFFSLSGLFLVILFYLLLSLIRILFRGK
ncbi:MAG TPA: CDP-diacylglycerol--serine O-phosphatidyltransferase [Prolixibacteraceae bacterium]|nr:CDP-diacylglycerol--serine O-phosphatidyltransferase [Prolixibacteraceae bacterium]